MKIGILEPTDFSARSLEKLKGIGEVSLFEGSDLINFVSDKTILYVRLNYYLNRTILEKAKVLQYICSPTTGLNHIDTNASTLLGIKIISLKNENKFLADIRATSEHTLGLIISLLRNYKEVFSDKLILDRDHFKGYEIFNNKIGIIGYGRIGKLLSQYITALGGFVYYFDPNEYRDYPNISKLESIDELVKKCEVICLCASYSEENVEMINCKIIENMKNKYFINTSRGELIDETFLIEKIKSNHFKGIALDVITSEAKKHNNLDQFMQIEGVKNFILTPHIGGATFTSMERTENYITDKLLEEIKL